MTAHADTRFSNAPRPLAVSIIAVINAVGLLITIAFWALVALKPAVPPPGTFESLPERVNAATTYGFMIGDLIWSVPLLAIAAIGLWKVRFYGWTAAQMANALWVFTLTVTWYRDAYAGISPGAVIFLPFALAAVWAAVVLWKERARFWAETPIRDNASIPTL